MGRFSQCPSQNVDSPFSLVRSHLSIIPHYRQPITFHKRRFSILIGPFLIDSCQSNDVTGDLHKIWTNQRPSFVPRHTLLLLRLVQFIEISCFVGGGGIKAFVKRVISLMSSLSEVRKLSVAFLNLMFLTMSIRSASNLCISSFCGGHFLDLNPNFSSVMCSLSSEFWSKKKAFHLILLITLSTFSIRRLRYAFFGGKGMFFIE